MLSYKEALMKNIIRNQTTFDENKVKDVENKIKDKVVEKRIVIENSKKSVKKNKWQPNDYQKSLLRAQNKMLLLCRPSDTQQSEILTCLEHLHNWSGMIIYLDLLCQHI